MNTQPTNGGETREPQEVSEARAFVRGVTQIAPYDDAHKNATGHRLTAFEAREAYGQQVLDEAVDYGSAIVTVAPTAASIALKQRREELGLTVLEAEKLLHLPVSDAEKEDTGVAIQTLEKIAMRLGLDERLLSFDLDAGADKSLGVRLRSLLTEPTTKLSPSAVLAFAEAASLIRIQNRLGGWLGLPTRWDQFKPSADYGGADNPAYRIGYELAHVARKALDLGARPIESMRDLVEGALGIPVIQRELPVSIAGATVSNGSDRGIVLNTAGANRLVWIRRATLAHELGHLLFDPSQAMQSVRVDLYEENERNPETAPFRDYVEQRANAFAVAFLAPPEAIRDLVSPPFSEDALIQVMQTFGLSATAARYHVSNAHWRQYDVPWPKNVEPDDRWIAAENYTLDYFPVEQVSSSRRGRFAGLVAASYKHGFISSETASIYLNCSEQEFVQNSDSIVEFFPIP